MIRAKFVPIARIAPPKKPVKPRSRALLAAACCAAALALCGSAALLACVALVGLDKPNPFPAAAAVASSDAALPAPAVAALRGQAWERAQERLDAADRASLEAINAQLASVNSFFRSRQNGSRPFAGELLGWTGGKWQYLRTRFVTDGDAEFAAYVREQFNRHVMTQSDLQQALRSSAEGYVSRLQGIENQLLIDLKADLSDDAMPFVQAIPELQGDQEFQGGFRKFAEEVAPRVGQELGVAVSRELVTWVVADVATGVVLNTLGAVAPGVLQYCQGPFAQTALTLGAAVVVGLAVDFVLDVVIRWVTGRDPEAELAGRVNATLENLRRSIVEGRGGLREELMRLHEVRSRLRREALKQLILEGGQ